MLTQDEAEKLACRDVTEMMSLFTKETKEILHVLQFHLYVEQLLERIVCAYLKHGNRLLEHGNLSFHQKLCVCDAMGVIDQQHGDALRKLNKLRNNCAHDRGTIISNDSIKDIGRCFGKAYQEIEKAAIDSEGIERRIVLLFTHIGKTLLSQALIAEHGDASFLKHLIADRADAP